MGMYILGRHCFRKQTSWLLLPYLSVFLLCLCPASLTNQDCKKNANGFHAVTVPWQVCKPSTREREEEEGGKKKKQPRLCILEMRLNKHNNVFNL